VGVEDCTIDLAIRERFAVREDFPLWKRGVREI
jgi:hypothetical protein